MSNGFLSQEEIDSLLNGGKSIDEVHKETGNNILLDTDKALLAEIGNISMGSASTALSKIINQQVNATTPVVTMTTLKELKSEFTVPNLIIEVEYLSGMVGRNLLVIKISDAKVIANLMMGGDGKIKYDISDLSEIEISAVQEAMNQMIGSAATSIATMIGSKIDISPPISREWHDIGEPLSLNINEEDEIAKVSFKLTIGDLIDSNIMQILPIETAKKIVNIMTEKDQEKSEKKLEDNKISYKEKEVGNIEKTDVPEQNISMNNKAVERTVEVHNVGFEELSPSNTQIESSHKNIDLILDVPLEVSVVLGRTKMNIKNVLELSKGSLIELDKLAEEPVEVLVNGKKIAYGEVVVVDENFGVRITNIVSSSERIKTLN